MPPVPANRRLVRRTAAAGALLAAVAAQTVPSASAATAGGPSASIGLVVRARAYGAVCDGTLRTNGNGLSQDTNGIQAAIKVAAASPAGGAVLLPPGRCTLSNALHLEHGKAVTIEGTVSSTGRRLTTVTDVVNPRGDGGALTITSDHNTVQDVILDQSGYGGGVYVAANNTTIQRTAIFGGKSFFAVFAAATSPGHRAVGNRLLSSTVVSLIDHLVLGHTTIACDDGISWSNQDRSLINDVDFTGTRLALYHDSGLTVSNFIYHPGPQTCGLDGYFITQPSSGITMSNLSMYGSGGVISNGSTHNGVSSAIVISHERVYRPAAGAGFSLHGKSHGLLIRNVDGVMIERCGFNSGDPTNSSIQLQPTVRAAGVVVEESSVPRISFFAVAARGSSTIGSISMARFVKDNFPALPSTFGSLDETFVNGSAAQVSFAVSGGFWHNSESGSGPHGGFFTGKPATYTVTGLHGY